MPLLVIVLVSVAVISTAYAHRYATEAADQKTKLENSQTEKQKLNDQLNESKQELIEQDDTHKQEIKKLQEENKSLNDQLQAKIEQKQKIAAAEQAKKATTVAAAPVASTPILAPSIMAGCGTNSFSQYIYAKESGCNLTVTNAEGCIGIGQACPASKLLAVCPALDFSCQDSFFTSYAVGRYGSWEGAYNFWLANNWW